MLARFQDALKKSHVNVVIRIFKYLQGTLVYGLWYPKNGDFSLESYTYANWAGCIDDWKRTSGGSFFLGGRLVSWHKKKQESISLSTTKVEYIATTTCYSQILWMKQTIKDIQLEYADPISIKCDN